MPCQEPIDLKNWEQAHLLPVAELNPDYHWHYCRSHSLPWADLMLVTTSYQAELEIPFEGTAICLSLDFGKTSADFCFSIDGGEWQPSGMDYQDWSPDVGWLRTVVIAGDLERGKHLVKIRTIRPDSTARVGSRFEIAMIGIVP